MGLTMVIHLYAMGVTYPCSESIIYKRAIEAKKQNTKAIFLLRVLMRRETSKRHNNKKTPKTARTSVSVKNPKPILGVLIAIKRDIPNVAL